MNWIFIIIIIILNLTVLYKSKMYFINSRLLPADLYRKLEDFLIDKIDIESCKKGLQN